MNKPSIVLAVILLSAPGVLAQGTVNFNNFVGGILRSPIYGVEPGNPLESKTGNAGSPSIPAGTQTYGGALLSGTGYTCELWGMAYVEGTTPPGEAALQFIARTTFRTAAGAGLILGSTVSVPNSPLTYGDAYHGAFQLRAWDNLGGTIASWSQAVATPRVAHGASEVTTSDRLGGTGVPPATTPILAGLRSFNLYVLPGLSILSISDIIVAEGSNGTVNASFPVTLSPPSDQVVTVDFATADGSALAGSDYVASSGTVTFQPGESNKTITVVLTADADQEADENFTVSLSNPTNAAIYRGTGTATITEIRIEGLAVDVAVSFHTVAGHVYLLEKTDISMTGGWTPVPGATNIAGTGGTVTAYDKGSGCPAGHVYRARLIQ